jgi:hypothetical protein
MFHAAMSGSTTVADLLHAHGCNEGYSFALHGAINFGHRDMVSWLLDHGATELDVNDFQGKTPLMRDEKGPPEIAQLPDHEQRIDEPADTKAAKGVIIRNVTQVIMGYGKAADHCIIDDEITIREVVRRYLNVRVSPS